MNKKAFFRVRVGVLLFALLTVLLYAGSTLRRRHARNDWERTLNVAIVLVRIGPIDEGAVASLRDRARALEEHLARELHRYRAAPAKPFFFVIYGPTATDQPPPTPASDGTIDLLRHAYAQWRWLRRIDAAAGIDTSSFDSCVYMVVRAPANERQWFVEGASEQGGRIGVIEVELDPAMVDFALFVATHELFHTLGALDRYDASGHTIVPQGLAEPERVPRFPQLLVEVMARGRPLDAGSEKPPDSIDELRVGSLTAEEIGWSPRK